MKHTWFNSSSFEIDNKYDIKTCQQLVRDIIYF